MNRLRAIFCALWVSGLLVNAAHAATIAVTTTDDIVAYDNLCSLREAVLAVKRAATLTAHKGAQTLTTSNLKTLDAALVTLSLNTFDTYPDDKLLPMLQVVQTDLLQIQTDLAQLQASLQALPLPLSTADATQLATVTTQLATIDTLLNADPNPNPPAPLPPYPPTYDPALDPYPEYATDNGITPMIQYLNDTLADHRDAGLPIVQRIRDLLSQSNTVIQAEIDRLNLIDTSDGCQNATSFDTIVLDKKTYTLDSELPIDTSVTIRGAGDQSIIQPGPTAPTGHRLLEVSGTLTLSTLLIQNASAAGLDGGAMRVTSKGIASVDHATFQGNFAANGGAIWQDDGGSLTVSNSSFYGNHAADYGGAIGGIGATMQLTQLKLGKPGAGNGNQADHDDSQPGSPSDGIGDGGAIYYAPASQIGSFSLDQSSVINNTANAGSGIRVVPAIKDMTIKVENVTFSQNAGAAGAALDMTLTGTGNTVTLNNITMAENDGGTATGGLRVSGTIDTFALNNSVIAGNLSAMTVTAQQDQDCDLTPFEPYTVAFLANVNRNYYGNVGGIASVCPGNRHQVDPTYTNYDLFLDAPGNQAVGPTGYLLLSLDATLGAYIPVFPIDWQNSAENRLVNRGASTQETYRCAATDQRGIARASFVDTDCDIGAIEYQIGQRQDDNATMPYSNSTCVDVAANDRGDAFYVPYSLQVLAIERPGAQAVVASTDPLGWLAAHPTAPATAVVDRATCPNASDFTSSATASSEVIFYTPIPGFIGETNVTYSMSWTTSDPAVTPVPGVNPEGGSVSGIAHMTTEAGPSISSSTLGAAIAPWSFLGAFILALRRRGRAMKAVVVGMLAVLAVALPHRVISANENVIYVNSGQDDLVPIPGDGKCTLREALNTARNDQANLTLGDCLDGNEGPDVIEFTPAVTDVVLEGTVDAWGGVTIRCPAKPAATTAVPSPVQQVCTIKPDPAVTPGFSLINSHGNISFLRMRLEGGNAGPNFDGGAVFSVSDVSITDSTFLNNSARTGGAVFLAGVRGILQVNNSLFLGNQSLGTTPDKGGGALAVSASDQHSLMIENSAFVQNSSVNAGGALLVSGTQASVIANSTFEGNTSALGSSVIDSTSASIAPTLRNLTIVGNTSGSSFTPAGTVLGAVNAGPMGMTVTDSIVASNYYVSTSGTVDANCSGPAQMQYYNNLFGEMASGATCPVGSNGNFWVQDTTVYDVATPSNPATYLWYLIDPNSTVSPYPQFDATSTGSAQWPPLAPPTFSTFHDATAVQGIIIDNGYILLNNLSDPALVDPLSVGLANCGTVDQRGVTRASGGRCDIGAIEWVKTTAVADAASNVGRMDRLVVADILFNDIYDATNQCVPTQIDNSTAGVTKLLDASNNPCAWVNFPTTTTAQFPVAFNVEFVQTVSAPTTDDPNNRTMQGMSALNGSKAVPGNISTTSSYVLVVDTHNQLTLANTPIVLTYHIYGANGVASADVPINITVDNVPPIVKDDTVTVHPGESATIDVLANDFDPDTQGLNPVSNDLNPYQPNLTASGLDTRSVTITGTSCNPVRNNNGTTTDGPVAYWQCQFGKATVDSQTGVITWVPDNKFNQWNESFDYQVKDYSLIVVPGNGPAQQDIVRSKFNTGHVTINVLAPTDGGHLGQNGIAHRLGINWLGATGNLFFLLLGASALRRRTR